VVHGRGASPAARIVSPVHSTTPLLATLSGFGLGVSLIVAIGAQNAYVLRQGLRLEHVAAVVAVCSASDAVLIALGVGGAGVLLPRVPFLLGAVRAAGAVFLLTYAVLSAWRAYRGSSALVVDATAVPVSLPAALTTCLAFTWLNPHVYLDTVVLLGSVGVSYGRQRWAFGLGAGLASLTWFVALGYGARLLRPLFARRVAWRILDGLIAAVMATLAVSLGVAA